MNLDRKSIVKFVASVSAILMLLTLLPSAVSAVADINECQSEVCSGECNRSCFRNCTEASNMFSGDCECNGAENCDCEGDQLKDQVRTSDQIRNQTQARTGDCDGGCVNQA